VASAAARLPAQSSLEVVVHEQKINESVGGFTGPLDETAGFGSRLARLHDLDGNGVDDLAVGAGDWDDARGALWILLLNADGTVLAEQQISEGVGGFEVELPFGNTRFGIALAPLGDFDGDGVDDLAVGSEQPAQVWLLMLNRDGTVKSWIEVPLLEQLGVGAIEMSLDNVGDLDGNGVVDLAFASPFSSAFAIGSAFLLFLDTDGSLLSHAPIGTWGLASPNRIGSVGDLDGNGVIDVGLIDHDGIAIFSYRLNILFLAPGGSVLSSQVIAEGQGGFTGAGPLKPSGVTSLGDLDHDGVPDLAVGTEPNGTGGVWILYMNADGTVRSHDRIAYGEGGFTGTFDPSDPDDDFGFSVACLDDLDGDGTVELAAGTPGDGLGPFITGESPGAVWILSLDDTWFDLGKSLAGVSGAPLLVGTGSLVAGSPGALTLSNAKASTICTLHVSLSSTPAAFKGGQLVAFPPVLNLPLVTGAGGTLALSFLWPAGLPAGTPLWLQYSIADPAAINKVSLSNALKAVQP